MSENIWFPCGSRAKARLHSVDSRGRSIDPEVLDVAQSIAPRVIAYAEELIGDPALATSLLEESAAIVSRSLHRGAQHGKPPVANVEGYLFRAFIRRINVTRRKQLLISRAVTAAQTGSPNGTVYLENFELKILADEFVTRCDRLRAICSIAGSKGSHGMRLVSSMGSQGTQPRSGSAKSLTRSASSSASSDCGWLRGGPVLKQR